MADTVTAATASPALATPTKKAKVSVKKPKAKPSHPKTSEMVNNAIKELKERGGSSLQAIKKYITANYKVDADKLAPFIKKYLKGAIESGALVQTKGKGASGSFKMEASKSKSSVGAKRPVAASKKRAAPTAAKKKKPAVEKPAEKKAGKKIAVKFEKTTSSPRSPAKKAASAKKPAAKTLTKANKSAKPPTKKPKTAKSKKPVVAPRGKKPAAKKVPKK